MVVLQGWVRWSNPPTTGGLELIAENLVKQHQAVRVGSYHQYITSYRGTFPSDPSSASTSSAGGGQRTLHTVLSPTSPYAFALFPSSSSTATSTGGGGKGKAREEQAVAGADGGDGLLVALTPPGSLNSLLALTKSPFMLAPGAGPNPNIPSAGLVTDMTPSNSSRNTRPTAQMLKLDGQVFEIAYPKASSFIPGLAAPPDGLVRETEFVVRVTGASGAGGLNRGLLVEIEWFPLPPSEDDDDEGDGPAQTIGNSEQEERLRTLLASLLPPVDGARTRTSAVRASDGDSARTVERGRTSARLLLDLLRSDGVI